MKISPLGGLPSMGRRAPLTPTDSDPGTEVQPSETSQLSGTHCALRSSEQLPSWWKNYEASLHLTPEASALRRKELARGGPEALFRMYPLLFHQDLRGPYGPSAQLLSRPGPTLTLAGDCHLGNFGTLRDRNDQVFWGLNDFDQAGPGRPEADLCRAGVSLLLLCHRQDWDSKTAEKLIDRLTHHYRKGLEDSPAGVLGLDRESARGPVHHLIKKAEKRTQEDLLAEWAEPTHNGYRFQFGEKLARLDEPQKQHLQSLLEQDPLPSGARLLDQARRAEAGGSSLGLQRYYLLVQPRSEKLPVVLEVKQVLPCALAGDDPDPSHTDSQLLEQGFRQLGAPKDPWQKILKAEDGVYLLRERQRARDSLKPEKLDREEAESLAAQMGQVLAQAHRKGSSQLAQWVGDEGSSLSPRLLEFSQSYASQVLQDYQSLSPNL